MTTMVSQITSLTVVYSVVYSGADQRKHQSSASMAFVRGIHRGRWIPVRRASNAENVSIWWRHHDLGIFTAQPIIFMCWDLNGFKQKNHLYLPNWNTSHKYRFLFISHHIVLHVHGCVIPTSAYTVKPVYNDHLMGYFSGFWSSSRWPRWAPEGRNR